MTPALRTYLELVQPERNTLLSRRSLLEVQAADKPLTLAFFLFMSARGVRITYKVEEWIRRAGLHCKELGMHEMGDQLLNYSREESGHDKMYAGDTRRLAIRWNSMFPENPVNAEQLLSADYLNPGEYAYHKVHEDAADSSKPFHLLAIGTEMERLSVSLVPDMLSRVEEILGKDVVKDLSFLKYHYEADLQHAKEKEIAMENLLRQYPADTDSLASTGESALRAFGEYLDDCMVLAKDLVCRSEWI